MKRFLALASCMLLLLSCPFLCGAQASDDTEDLTLASGKRITPSLRIVLPVYVGASVPVDVPFGQDVAFNFGIEALGLRLSSKSSPLETNIGMRWSGMYFRPDEKVFHLGVPLRVACKLGGRGKVFAGAAAEMRVGGSPDFSRFMGVVEGGVSFYGFGLRASYTLTPYSGDSRAVSLGLVIGI